MWILYAVGSAFFAGITAIIAKIGVKNVNSTVATAVRTVVVLIFSWVMVLIVGSAGEICSIDAKSLIFLMLSGLATGASWLCYFRALALGEVNKVAPVDKSSTVLTMLMAFAFLGEAITPAKIAAIVLIGAGTFLMIMKPKTAEKTAKSSDEKKKRGDLRWLIYAAFSAVFAALTAILGKIGINGVEAHLGTALRTVVVLLMAWVMVLVTKKGGEVKKIDRKSLIFIPVSGLTTGLSWMCYYIALKDGEAGAVVPIDKMSILITYIFACVFLRERARATGIIGLLLMSAGTLLTVIG